LAFFWVEFGTDNFQLNCFMETWSTFVSNNYISTNCIQYCPLECYSITYSVTTGSSNYPSYNYALDSLMTNLSFVEFIEMIIESFVIILAKKQIIIIQ
jgi:hypothetical protein